MSLTADGIDHFIEAQSTIQLNKREFNMPVTLLKDRYPDVFKLSTIYDPDVDGTDPELAVGKHIPAVGSIVLDMLQPANTPIPAFVVVSVDETTYKSTLRPLTSILELNAIPDRIISYGDDMHMLYYDDRETPTKLRIDSNLLILGDNSSEYILYQRDQATGQDIPISLHIDNTGTPQGERVPIITTATPGVRRGNDCYTSVPMAENDLITMKVFDASGVQIMALSLITKRSTILNDLDTSVDVVTAFNVTANQQRATGEMVLFTGQEKEDLAIFPELEFSTGEKLTVPVDNMSSFMYGWEDVKSKLPGCEYEILFKYFLTPNLLTTIGAGEHVTFVTTTKTVVIDTINQFSFSKISVMPKFNTTLGEYQLKFYAYYVERGGYKDVTNDVTYVGNAFDGSSAQYGTLQNLTINVPMTLADGSVITYTQSFCITCNLHNGVNENYLIQDTPTSVLIYGAQDASHNRPIINYDSSLEQYFIPTSEFINKDRFIEYFYTNSEPPFVPPNESVAPDPTHFTIRNINTGGVILASEIDVDNYDQSFSLITGGTPGLFNDTSVIVEFLKQDGTGYQILYAVPVEVRSGNYIP